MSQTFDIQRFNNYLVYFLKTGIKRHTAIVGALLGATLLMVIVPPLMFDMFESQYQGAPYNLYSGGDDPMWDMEISICTFMLGLIVIVSASMMFSDFGNKASRLDALMLPASALEKYLTRWIVFVPLTGLACMIGFEIIDVIRCLLITLKYGPGAPVHLIGFHMFSDNLFAEMMPFLVLNLYIAIFALGAIVWPRLSCIKTFGIVSLLQVVYSWWLVMLMPLLIGDMVIHYKESLIYQEIIILAVTLAIYVIAYYRLKEIELVQRW